MLRQVRTNTVVHGSERPLSGGRLDPPSLVSCNKLKKFPRRHFFKSNPIARAIRLTEPTCRRRAAAISAAPYRRGIIAESLLRSSSLHSFGFEIFMVLSSRRSEAGDTGKFTGAIMSYARRSRKGSGMRVEPSRKLRWPPAGSLAANLHGVAHLEPVLAQ